VNLVNRGVVVIKPREPFLDWVNRNPDFSPPVTMEEVQQDCTVLLVPDLGSPEAVLDYVAPLKPGLLEMELEDWNRDSTAWPAERTSAQFDAWFTLEVHSMVWDTLAAPIVKEGVGEAVD